MDGPPSTPPRRNVVHRAGAHLHKRTTSKITLMLSPPTPPHGGTASSAYRIVPESPSANRVMSPPAKRSALAKISWGPTERSTKKQGAGGGGFWTRRRVVVLAGLVLVVVLLARGPTRTAWGRWSDGGDVEQATYGRGNADKPSPRVPPVAALHPPEPQFYPAPPKPLAPGAGPPPAPPPMPQKHRPHPAAVDPHDRFRKVAAKPVVAAPAALPPPSHDLEVTSATDPDSARRFLLIGWMGEQETKAQQHLYQLGLLALALNRTLVLPNVKRSRFGTCYHHPFSLYYAEDTLSRFGIPYITSDEFWAWTDRQRTAPSAQVVSFVRGPVEPVEAVAITPQHMCLSERNLDFGEFKGKAFFSPNADWKSVEAREQYGIEVVQELLKQERVLSAEGQDDVRTPAVLVTHFNLRYPFLAPSAVSALSPFDFPPPSPYSYFAYSSHWTALGESIAASLSPFVAVHWRTETLPVDILLPCGDALIASLHAIKRAHPKIQTVYLATDYPIEVLRHPGDEKSATAHSGTMTKTLTPGHHAAMRAFLGKLEGADVVDGEGASGLRITTFMEEQARVELPPDLKKAVGRGGLQDVDGAIVGIVDKIVLMSAEVFFAGLPVSESAHGCAKLSQFTTQVVSGRHDLRAQGGDEGARLWNEVEHFSLGGGRAKQQWD
ncbi:hypothetical protein JCM10449v2_007544 [Rhodotorula kratochvilovae]